MSWAVGWFNDWWIEDQAFDDSGNQYSARLTGLPLASADGANYLHTAVSVRRDEADLGAMRFRGRPESNVASYYVDTGSLPADHSTAVALEGVAGRGPFFTTAEWIRSTVDTVDPAHPTFWGAYLTVSYVLTGEHRPYDRKVAYARRILPERRWGAWEIFARYSHIDLDDQAIRGGTMNKGALGLTWWATRRWRLGIDIGLTDLDRGGVRGRTVALHPRVQWVF